eukprot:7140030-Pyramimonas_sp.AAC.1
MLKTLRRAASLGAAASREGGAAERGQKPIGCATGPGRRDCPSPPTSPSWAPAGGVGSMLSPSPSPRSLRREPRAPLCSSPNRLRGTESAGG